jgi:hypothetical protein
VPVETMVAGGLDRLKLARVLDAEIPQSLKDVEKAVTDRGPGAHPLLPLQIYPVFDCGFSLPPVSPLAFLATAIHSHPVSSHPLPNSRIHFATLIDKAVLARVQINVPRHSRSGSQPL